MNVFATPDNPIPATPTVLAVRTRDGVNLRVAYWPGAQAADSATPPPSADPPAQSACCGTVVVATGRGEFIEMYFGVIGELLARGFAVVAFDWRGQGLSGRQLSSPRRGHVSSFAAYGDDLHAIETQVLAAPPSSVGCQPAPKPWFALAHSMGAAVVLDQAYGGTSPFARLVLTAPMIDVALPYRSVRRAALAALTTLGLGRRFIPGGRERPRFIEAFEGNAMTADRRQYDRLVAAIDQLPDHVVGSPTLRWSQGALTLMRRFRDPGFAVRTTVPTLIVVAGMDRVVRTAAAEDFAMRLRAGHCVRLPDARHQLTMERADVLAQFWAAFDAFIPGECRASARSTFRSESHAPGQGQSQAAAIAPVS